MARERTRSTVTVAALLAALVWLAIGVSLLDRFGPTWDCANGEFPLGESLLHALTSSASLRQAPLQATFGELRAPHPAFALESPWWASWPLASTLSAASCRIFWGWLGVLPAMSAHLLPGVGFVALLVAALVRWTGVRAGAGAALLAPLFLLTSPRFFADAFVNLKDAPEAALFTIALFAFARAVRDARRGSWLLAGALGGAALAQKSNGIFLPVELVAWVLLCRVFRTPLREPTVGGASPRGRIVAGIALALGAWIAVYFALSPQFWFDPAERLSMHWSHVFRTGNVAFRVAERGNASTLAKLRIDPDGVLQTLWTTPIPVLAFFLAGLFAPVFARRDRWLLSIATLVPIARTLIPGMTNFDGVRHFEEFLPPMCVVAAGGLAWIARLLARAVAARTSAGWRLRSALPAALAAAALAPGAHATFATFPNGAVYYNAFVGGLGGAQARSVRDATDYWCNSYWQAADWLDRNAEGGAAIHAAVAPHVMRAIAPVRLRPDLRMVGPDTSAAVAPLYVVFVTRPAFYGRFARHLDATRAPLYTIEVDGGAILHIHRFAAGADAAAALDELRTDRIDEVVRGAVAAAWWSAPPQRARAIRQVIGDRRSLGHDEALRRLRALLPPELSDAAEEFVRALEADDADPPGPGNAGDR